MGQSSDARNELFLRSYEALRKMAASFLRRERVNHTLQPTALVHETYLKFLNQDRSDWKSDGDVLTAAYAVMRLILLQHARGKSAIKRGRGAIHVELTEDINAPENRPDDFLALLIGIEKLHKINPTGSAAIILSECGYRQLEIAEYLGIGERTVRNRIAHAKAWLFSEITGGK